METERKSKMVSVRLEGETVSRIDYVARNTGTPDSASNRSTTVRKMVLSGLEVEETKLRGLGVLGPKKAHP